MQPPIGGGPVYRTQPGTRELPPRYAPPAGPNATARLAYWNEVALRAVAVDHTPAVVGSVEREAEQLGPTRTSRAMAIVHLAVYDALNAIARRYPGYSGQLDALPDSSQDAAIAQATHDTRLRSIRARRSASTPGCAPTWRACRAGAPDSTAPTWAGAPRRQSRRCAPMTATTSTSQWSARTTR
ncbi:hypothetical protein G4G28_02705 [Massilia sp. Dwa41.01b]|nr:hypothetical protein G4G28_02705 [Massilia sp. Dwa41.01b]